MSDVRALVLPRSIAVVGASPRNLAAVETVVRSGVPAWGVNPNRDEVAGLRCYPSFADLPSRDLPEMAFLMVNHERVEHALEEAAAAGVRAFVVPGVGAEARSGREAHGRATRSSRERPRCSAPRSELHGFRRSRRPRGLEREPAPDDRARARRRPLPVRVDRRRVPLARRPDRPSVRDLVGRRGGDGRGRFPVVLRRRRRDPSGRALPRDRETTGGVPPLARLVRGSRKARRVSQGRPLGGGRRAPHCPTRARSSARSAPSRPCSEGTRRSRSATSTSSWRLSRYSDDGAGLTGPESAAISESGGECALLADNAEAAGVPFQPLPSELAAELSHAFPNFVAPGNPLDAWGHRRRERGLSRIARAHGQGERVRHSPRSGRSVAVPRPGNDHWCELTLRTLARLAEQYDLFCAMTTVHSADPPHAFKNWLRSSTCRSSVARATRCRRSPTWRCDVPGDLRPVDRDPPDLRDLLVSGSLPEHESALVLERYGVEFAPRLRAASPEEAARAAEELGSPLVVKRDGPAHKSRDGGVVLDVASPPEAADAARRLGGPGPRRQADHPRNGGSLRDDARLRLRTCAGRGRGRRRGRGARPRHGHGSAARPRKRPRARRRRGSGRPRRRNRAYAGRARPDRRRRTPRSSRSTSTR